MIRIANVVIGGLALFCILMGVKMYVMSSGGFTWSALAGSLLLWIGLNVAFERTKYGE